MKKLFLDIETLPAAEEQHKILREIHKRKFKKNSKYQKTFEEFVEETGLDGSFGRILCISYAIDDQKAETLLGIEPEILKQFWQIAKQIDLFVGFNIYDFDLRFIYQRSIIQGIRPTQNLPFTRYRNFPIYDCMHEWNKWSRRSSVNLDKLAKAMGIPSSKDGGIDGRDVAKFYLQGRIKEICNYCERDVEVTRKIYKRMIFEE